MIQLFKPNLSKQPSTGQEYTTRPTARVLHISRNTVSSQLKEKRQVVHMNPKHANKGLTVKLKVDEMCRAAGAVVREL